MVPTWTTLSQSRKTMKLLAQILFQGLVFQWSAYTSSAIHNETNEIINYTLCATQDVLLEGGTTNMNHFDFLIVAKHPWYPNKHSLIQFESIPSSCQHIVYASMYLHYWYAHKSSSCSDQECPYTPRHLRVNQVKNYSLNHKQRALIVFLECIGQSHILL